MDDLQFRRSIYADPHVKDDEILAAIADDPKKAQFAKEVEALDNQLNDAMNVPVPDGLQEKLILRQTMASHQQVKKKKRIHLALAASVVFALAVSINIIQFSPAYGSLGDYALAHANHVENPQADGVTLANLNKKMANFDGSFVDNVKGLLSADYCNFGGVKSLHLVFQGEQNAVDVFVVPASEQMKFESDFSDSRLNGIASQYQKGNLIIVGDKSEQLNRWQQELNSKLKWRA